MDKLPVYEMVINPDVTTDVEVSFVALVDKPAIERNFLAFKDIKLNFQADPEKKIISGPAMVADSLIYRRDENGEYNVFFSKETIREIAVKFFKKDYQKNLNLFHDPSLSLEGVTIFESFMSDKDRGVSPMKGFEDLPDGSWFISAKIENDAVWQKIKSGEVKGFSVEGIFSYVKKPKPVEEQIYEVLNRTGGEFSHLSFKESIMQSLKDMIAGFKKKFDINTPAVPAPPPVTPPAATPPVTPQAMGDYALKDGTKVTCDRLEPGGVMMIGEAPAPAGEHELADGMKVTVGEGGVITAVTPAAGAIPPGIPGVQMSEVKAAINKALSPYIQKLADAETKLAAQVEANIAQATKLAAQSEQLTQLFVIVEKIADLPTEQPNETRKDGFKSDRQKDIWTRRSELAESLSKIKAKN